jgi:hypothetical protein
MKRPHLFSALLAMAAFVMLTSFASAEFIPVGSLLFQDAYSIAPVTFDINSEINSPTRTYGPLAGHVSYDQANAIALMAIDGPNQILQVTGTSVSFGTIGRVGLTQDFNNDLALGGFTVCAKINPMNGYGGIGVGHNGSTADSIGDLLNATTPPGDVPGFYGNVFANFGVSTGVFGSAGMGSLWYSHLPAGSPYGGFVDLAMVFTDDTDNNPFNGSGTITAKVYVEGILVDTATGPDFAHNYISLQGAADGTVAEFQNLRIYGNAAAVPEPGTLVLLAAAAGFAFVWLRRSR